VANVTVKNPMAQRKIDSLSKLEYPSAIAQIVICQTFSAVTQKERKGPGKSK
jgi:hypothetical protein